MSEAKIQPCNLRKNLGLKTIIGLFLMSACAVADEPAVGWEETFDDTSALKRIDMTCYRLKDPDKWPDVVTAKVEDGALIARAVTEKEMGQISTIWGWGDGMRVWDTTSFAPFEPVDLLKYPIIEFRWKPVTSASWYVRVTYETKEGKKHSDYLSWRHDGKDGWRNQTFRTNQDSSAPSRHTPVRLLGICVIDANRDREVAIAFDYIRVRAFNEEEAKLEAPRAERLKRYSLPDIEWMKHIYPYGPLSSGEWRAFDADFACGGIEAFYGDLVRHHMNLILRDHREPYRLRNHPGCKSIPVFIEKTREHLAAAHNVGLLMGRDVMWLAEELDKHGIKETEKEVKHLTTELADEENLVAWYISDEPAANIFWPVVCVKQMFEDHDPNRLVTWAFNSVKKASLFEPYISVLLPDRYPIYQHDRNPWEVRHVLAAYRANIDRTTWFIGQAFGSRWEDELPRDKRGHPTRAEFRLMYHIAIAEGIKGITFFKPTGYGNECMFDRVGMPSPFMADVKNLGRRLAGIGILLIKADVEDDSGVSVRTAKTGWVGKNPRMLSVATLKARNRAVRYLIVINESVKVERRGELVLPDRPNTVVLNADTFEELRPIAKDQYLVSPLAAGDAHFFVAGPREEVNKDVKTILANRAKETLRVMKPDLLIAERWGCDLSGVKAVVAASKPVEAAALLEKTLAGHQAYSSCKWELESIRPTVARAVDDIFESRWNGNAPARAGREKALPRIRALGVRHSALRARLIHAEKTESLPADIAAYRRDLAKLIEDLGLPR